MAGLLRFESTHHGSHEGGMLIYSSEKPEEGGRWYFTRKEIEENSLSRQDGIDLKKETYLRKSYCTFLQDLGIRLKVPQITIATAIIFCHRFFLRQSHVKNDRRTIATVCMFLAGKVEETPRPLRDVILVSYEIIHKKDPGAALRIKQKEVYEQQKELILLGERLVLATLDFDLNILHPYKPLVEAIKKFKVAQNALAQVAWNFVNDGLRTSLSLQFEPHHIAAGAIFLAAKFLKVKLPSDGDKVWWQEFDVTPRQLEEVSNQMLELYEQTQGPPSQGSEVEGSTTCGASHEISSKSVSGNFYATADSSSQAKGMTNKSFVSKLSLSRPADYHGGPPTTSKSSDYRSSEMRTTYDKVVGNLKDSQHEKRSSQYWDMMGEARDKSVFGAEHIIEKQQRNFGRAETREEGNSKGKLLGQDLDQKEDRLKQPYQEAMRRKAALERQRKSHADFSQKSDLIDEDDLIERELGDGVELAVKNERNRQDRQQCLSLSSEKLNFKNSLGGNYPREAKNAHQWRTEARLRREDLDNFEEGELSELDDSGQGLLSPKTDNRKRKMGTLPAKFPDGKKWHHLDS